MWLDLSAAAPIGFTDKHLISLSCLPEQVEHHDFPQIPARNLPKLTKIAPEYYKTRPTSPGWLQTTLLFVLDDDLGPHCRVVRRT